MFCKEMKNFSVDNLRNVKSKKLKFLSQNLSDDQIKSLGK